MGGNITDATTQQRMYAQAADIPRKPYPSVDGIKVTMALYDSPEMRKHKPEDFYDPNFIADPVSWTLTSALGDSIAKPVEILFVIGFLASFLALQTSASRVIWAYARDNALPGSGWLVKLSSGQKQPVNTILVTTVIGAALFLLNNLSPNIYLLMVNFTTGGFFIAFLFPLVGFLIVQLRGNWKPGPWTLGSASLIVTVLAVVWALFEFLNISWPRPVNADRYLDWSVWIAVVGLGIVGALIYASIRSRVVDASVIDDEELRDELADAAGH